MNDMNWFDEQIRQKKHLEEEAVNDMYLRMVEAVNGIGSTVSLRDERKLTIDAVGSILEYYHVDAREIPDRVTETDEMLEYLLRPSGIMTREVKLVKGWRRDAIGAMLTTFKESGKPVALIPTGSSHYFFFNPESGHREIVTNFSEKLFSDEAIVFYKPFPMRKMDEKDLLNYIRDNIDRGSMLLYTFVTFVVMMAGLLVPWQTGVLFSSVVPSGNYGILLAMAIFIFCTSLSTFLLEILKSLILNKIALKLDLNIEAAAMMRILSLPVSFFNNYNSGDLANRVQYMSNLSSELFVNTFSTMVVVVFSMIYLIQMMILIPDFLIPVVLLLVLSVLVVMMTAYFQSKISLKQMKLSSKEKGTAYSILSGIKKIKICGAEDRALVKWGRDYAAQAAFLYNPPMLLKMGQVLTFAISLIGTVYIYYTAVVSGVDISSYYCFNAAYGIISGSLALFSETVISAARALPTFELVRPIMEAEPAVSEDKPMVDKLKGEVEFDNVTFSYGADSNLPIIDGLSLTIKPGEYVGIVGKTGCGKSTLMRLMLGFETPQKGTIFYDKKNMNNLDLKSLCSGIGTVLQDGKLLTGSIYSNITINAPGLTVDEVWKIVDMVGLGDDIKAMPMQLFTQIAESADNISGGQKQRIMLARALASNPRILLLDEATSSLDNINQKKIAGVLDSLDCTKIVIAHSLSVVRNCDRILMMDNGNIAEDGSYDDLMARNGVFSEFVERQMI